MISELFVGMKHLFVLICILCSVCSVSAQKSPQDVVATIDGRPITRGAFRYAYEKNKALNGQTILSPQKYWPLFLDYQLKLADARALRLDTSQTFQREYRAYRDQQLTKHLAEKSYIDSLARDVYQKEKQALNGKDIINVSHILVTVPSTATATERNRIAQRADSVYQALIQGGNFATLAQQFSQDEYSAREGGALPPLYPGMTLLPFEEAAYALQVGQVSRPILTELGYHIILMRERHPLPSFEQSYPQILEMLRSQGAEEAAAQHQLASIEQRTHQSRAAIMDSLATTWTNTDQQLRYLIEEYHDGLLVFQVSQQRVWAAAEKDTLALENTFKRNKKALKWAKPRFKGYIISAYDKKIAKRAAKLLRKGIPHPMEPRDFLQPLFNKDSVVVMAKGRYLVEQGENSTIDNLAFKMKTAKVYPLHNDMPITIVAGRVEKRPTSYEDARSEVLELRQKELEAAWLKQLHATHQVIVHQDVLKSL